MKPITSREITFNSGGSIKLRLGDILILDSPLKAHNQGDISQFIPLAILVVGFFASKIYFTLLGLDTFQYSISKHTKKGLVLLNRRGKEIKMSEEHIVKLFKEFARRRSSDVINGMHLYLRTLITNRSQLGQSSGRKISKRLINMVEWPDRSLITWAKKHLCVPSQYVPRIDHLNDKYTMINDMIKLSTTRAKVEPKVDLGKLAKTYAEVTNQPETASGRPTWGPGVLEDSSLYYETGIVHNVDISQQERMVIENIGEAPSEIVVSNSIEPGQVVMDEGERRTFHRDLNGKFTSQPQDVVQSKSLNPITAEALWGALPSATNEDDPDEIR